MGGEESMSPWGSQCKDVPTPRRSFIDPHTLNHILLRQISDHKICFIIIIKIFIKRSNSSKLETEALTDTVLLVQNSHATFALCTINTCLSYE